VIRAALLVAALVVLAPRVGTAQILWQFDESSSAVDGDGVKLYGGDTRRGEAGTEFTDAQVIGGGPNGGDSVLFTYLSWPDQIYAGGEKTVAAPAYGTTRFYRGRLRYHMGDEDDVHTQKLFIVADGATDNRPILTIGTHLSPPNMLQFRMQLDGGVDPINSSAYTTDVWLHWQVEVSPGTSDVADDGYYKLWTATSGTMTYASPHGTVTGVAFTDGQRGAQGSFKWGHFMNDSCCVNAWTIEFADFEIATTFDANWPTTSGGGGSPASLVRIRRRAGLVDAAGSAVALLALLLGALSIGALRTR
jgi:hypothetical protein